MGCESWLPICFFEHSGDWSLGAEFATVWVAAAFD
jgi:hypothetical protein